MEDESEALYPQWINYLVIAQFLVTVALLGLTLIVLTSNSTKASQLQKRLELEISAVSESNRVNLIEHRFAARCFENEVSAWIRAVDKEFNIKFDTTVPVASIEGVDCMKELQGPLVIAPVKSPSPSLSP